MSSEQLHFNDAVTLVRNGRSVHDVAAQLLSCLTTTEKLSTLTGPLSFWPGLRGLMGGSMNDNPYKFCYIDRLGIPGVRFCDGPRGIVVAKATSFPAAMSRGATWDVELEEEVGAVFAAEARALGANMCGATCINLPRHPAWGRSQETYSEDPVLLGEFGIALTKGLQDNGVMATAKHFALNSMEDMRFKVDVKIDDEALHEVYLPHFEMVVKEGKTLSMMSSYNAMNGEWCGQNDVLLNKILRDEWGFPYFVISDWVFGLRDSAKSLKNGLDLEAPFAQVRYKLEQELKAGKFTMVDVDRSASRILVAQLELYSKRTTPDPDRNVVFCQEHRDLARKVAARTMVLLKNEPVPIAKISDSSTSPLLPIDPSKSKSIAVIGKLANANNSGDWGSSYVSSPNIVSPYEGIKSAFSTYGTKISLVGTDDVNKAQAAAREADIAILVIGYGALDEGENLNASTPMSLIPFPSLGQLIKDVPLILFQQAKERLGFHRQGPSLGGTAGGDRKSVRFPAKAIELVRAVTKINPRTLVVTVSSGAVIVDEWIDEASTVLMSWYSGCEGGDALADVILGRVDTSGRLPFSVPHDESHLPSFDATATSVTYDKWFGQRLLDKNNIKARFPLGYGLSYTTFKISDLIIDNNFYQSNTSSSSSPPTIETETIKITVKVTNTGSRPGRHVVQVYGCPQNLSSSSNFPTRVLMGFAAVATLQPQETRSVDVKARTRPLKRWKGYSSVMNNSGSSKDGAVAKKSSSWELASKVVEIEVGSFAGDRAVCEVIEL